MTVKVRLHNPKREIELDGPITIVNLLGRLGLHRDAVLVIRGGELVPGDATIAEGESIEVRPVISGGAS